MRMSLDPDGHESRPQYVRVAAFLEARIHLHDSRACAVANPPLHPYTGKKKGHTHALQHPVTFTLIVLQHHTRSKSHFL
jgi:hypothetical protein